LVYLKKKKSIIITNPHLKRIRYNFRRVIKDACRVEQSKIHSKEEKLMGADDFYDNEKYRKPSRELDDQFWAIERPLRASILICPVCFRSNKNVTYNPVQKVWYCIEHYNKLRDADRERGTAETFP